MDARGRMLVLVGSVLIVVGVVLAIRQDSAPQGERPEAAGGGLPDSVAAEGPRLDLEEATGPKREVVDEGGESSDDVAADGTRVAEPSLAGLTGRFVLPDGSPAAGVRLSVHGWGANQERMLKYGAPADWKDPRGETGPDGRFLIEFDAPPAFQFTLDAELDPYVGVNWRWGALAAGGVKNLGTIVLQRGGVIEGRIVDAAGTPVPGPWDVHAESAYTPDGEGGDETRVHASVDPGTARFRLVGLPAGPARLMAHSRMANWIRGPTVEVDLSRVTKADIVYDAADLSGRITVTTSNTQFRTYRYPQPGTLVLRRADGFEAPFEDPDGFFQTYVVDGLTPGTYSVHLEDPRFDTFTETGVRPGSHVTVYCEGNAAVKLLVLDDATGEQINFLRVRVRMDESDWSPNEFEIRGHWVDGDQGDLYDDLIPETQTFFIDADGCATAELAVKDLRPHEVRALTVRMSGGVRLFGRATQGGRPAGDLSVILTEHIEIPDRERDEFAHYAALSDRRQCQKDGRDTTTDADDGSFEFVNVPNGVYDVTITKNSMLETTVGAITVNDAEPPEVEVELPDEGIVRGRILGPPGAIFDGLLIRIVAGEATTESEFPAFFMTDVLEQELDAAGDFQLEGLPAGTVRALLKVADTWIPHGFGGSSGQSGATMELGRIEVRPDQITEVVFDVKDRFPGRLQVTVRVDGEYRRGLVLEAARPDRPGSGFGASLGDHDPATVGPISTGLWCLSLRPIDGAWWYELPTQVAVGSAAIVPVAFMFGLRSGQLVVRDAATKTELAGEYIEIGSPDRGPSRILVADGNGLIRLEMPEGTYEVRHRREPRHAFGSSSATILHWSGPTLPQSIEIEIESDR